MPVKKRWITQKRETSLGYGCMVERKWEGIFLFGFLPLWIENTSTIYK